MAHKVQEYRTAIHDIFAKHDADKSGFIEGDEKYEFSMDVAKLMVPNPGPEREAVIAKVWETMAEIDTDGDERISWDEFWRFVTKGDVTVQHANTAPEQKLVKFGAYVLVMVQRADGSLCLVQTDKGWWCVGGDVPMGQSPETAAIALTKQQAGIDVRLEGVLRVEFDHRADGAGSRLRTIYLARALNDFEPLKTVPDDNSLGAVWTDGSFVTMNNERIPLAGSEPAVWFEYILRLGPVYPLEVFTSEGAAPHDRMLTSQAHAPFADMHRSVITGGEFQTTLGPVYPNSP